MLCYTLTVTYANGSETVDVDAKDTCEAMVRLGRMLAAKQKRTGNFREILSVTVDKRKPVS